MVRQCEYEYMSWYVVYGSIGGEREREREGEKGREGERYGDGGRWREMVREREREREICGIGDI